jgi:DNA-binding GntR family transcriptional regulator
MSKKVKEKPAAGTAEDAYRRLLELISDGKIREAQFLSHRDLAARLGMSKMPVGTALKRLEREGLVESVQRVGTRVCRIDADAMWGILQWRIALECQTARLACEWIKDGDRARLMETARDVDRIFRQDAPRSHQVDAEFHLTVGDLSGCPRLRAELDRLNIFQVKLAVCEAVSAAMKTPPQPPPTHEELAAAIAEGPGERAEQCMRDHLEKSTAMYGFTQWYRQTHRPQGPRDE